MPTQYYPTPGQQTGISGFVHNNLGRLAIGSANPYLMGGYAAYRLGGGVYNALANHFDPTRNPQEPWSQNATKSYVPGSQPAGGLNAPSGNVGYPVFNAPNAIPGETMLPGGGAPGGVDPNTGQPVYQPFGTGNFNAPPPNSAGTPNQLTANRETAAITGFQQMQDASAHNFNRPDMIGLDGRTGFGPAQATTANQGLAYQSMNPIGNTLQGIKDFNSGITSGATPSWQQTLGRPAYIPGSIQPPSSGIAGGKGDLIPPGPTQAAAGSSAPDYQSQISNWIKANYPGLGG